MCKVRCKKHQQCACECRPLHFQRRTTLYHVPKVSHSLLISTEQRQIHTQWCWDSYVYASYKSYGRTVCQIARRNRFSRPLTILDIPASTPSIPNQNQEEPHHPLTHVWGVLWRTQAVQMWVQTTSRARPPSLPISAGFTSRVSNLAIAIDRSLICSNWSWESRTLYCMRVSCPRYRRLSRNYPHFVLCNQPYPGNPSWTARKPPTHDHN